MPAAIPQLIISSPYAVPERHWRYDRETRLFTLEAGRRPAGYVVATPGSRSFDDPGVFVELPLVNQIRRRVDDWRAAAYPGVTGVTRRLLAHWRDPEQRRDRRFFFCQLEAMETLIWLAESPDADRVGIDVPGDGGEFRRLCTKMATGSGKTIVMAMLVAWQVLNKVAYPQDPRFAKHVFVVAPGLTVKHRLQVLLPAGPGNYYDEFNVVPAGMEDQLRQGKVHVRNWHALLPLDPDAGPRVVKKGAESDEAFARRVLEELAAARSLLVINDEAHHAWRLPAAGVRGVSKDDLQQATQWIGGLDRVHRARGIHSCYDFSATPYAPTGKSAGEGNLFDWIVSDFSLNDAIESGLVKTPRVVVRDDGAFTTRYKSRLYHLYADPEVKDDLTRPAQEQAPLPDLVVNGYYLLGQDWQETARAWRQAGSPTPPVMITVANRTETAARVAYAFTHGKIDVEGLKDADATLHIDSRVLAKAESRDDAPEDVTDDDIDATDPGGAAPPDRPNPVGAAPRGRPGLPASGDASSGRHVEDGDPSPGRPHAASDQAEALRQVVDTVGQPGKPGEQVRNVISVGMLTEGWDAKTVTHIMGLRAFTSQLLCEQVVGRGLRRTSYEVDAATGLFEPEYVNIFGVPFTFLPHEGGDGPPPPPPSPKTRVEPVPEKAAFAITFPNVLRIDHEYRPRLTLDLERLPPLQLNAADVAMLAELAPVVAGKPDVTRIAEIDLLKLGRGFRTQKIIFETARDVFDQIQPSWKGNREQLLAQLVALVERVVASDRLQIQPALFAQDPLRRRVVITINLSKLVQHIWEAIRFENAEVLTPVFDTEHPLRSTADVRAWYTSKPCAAAQRSHVNVCTYDSTWEAGEAYELERSPRVVAWVKNDHLGFEILYTYKGVVHKYLPDFLIRLTDGSTLVLEVKGQDDEEQRAKRRFLAEWIAAVNAHGGFGHWASAVSRQPKDVLDILAAHAGIANPESPWHDIV